MQPNNLILEAVFDSIAFVVVKSYVPVRSILQVPTRSKAERRGAVRSGAVPFENGVGPFPQARCRY